jgi:NAD(P)-dependent dehydrogenase (short-subunit alcohol dehydrogenase family)
MLKTLAALVFYARFAVPFSTVGHRRRLAAQPAPPFDFRGQRWWVTGATGGIGRAIALGALAGGAEVWALARDNAKLVALRASGALDSRSLLLSMSSGGAYGAKLDVESLESRDAATHDGFMAYAQHKRAQIELTRWWNAQADAPRALVMHPGWVDTDGVRSSLPGFRRVMRSVLRTPAQGADTALWLAATRPAPASDGGLWLDRHRDPEHAFAMTRGGDDANALVHALRQRLVAIEASTATRPAYANA